MKKTKTFLVYLLLCISIVLTSLVTTLALVTDEHKKTSGLITFDQVSLCADKNGSVLSIELDEDIIIGDGEIIFDLDINEKQLYFKATEITVDFYARVQVYFTINGTINQETQNLLDSLNNSAYPLQGLKMYSDENYGYTFMDGWYYLVTMEDGELLKVGSAEDQFIISQSYKLNLSHLDENTKDQIHNLFSKNELLLNVSVQAVQAQGVSDIEENNNAFDSESNKDILISENTTSSKESNYGNTKIIQFKQAILDNLGFPAITLSFDKVREDAIGSIENKTIFYGDFVDLSANNITSEDFRIIGWLVNGDESKLLPLETVKYSDIVDLVDGNKFVTLKAKWEIIFKTGLPTVQTSFNNMTWSQIQALSNCIETGSTKYYTVTPLKSYDGSINGYSVYEEYTGVTSEVRSSSTKTIQLTKNGTSNYYTVSVIGFLHDTDAYGNKIGITMRNITVDSNLKHCHRGSQTNSGGYFSETVNDDGSVEVNDWVRKAFNNNIIYQLPEDLLNVIVPAHKAAYYKTYQGDGFVYRNELLWLFSTMEIKGTGISGEGTKYPYFGSTKLSVKNDNYPWWLTRTIDKNDKYYHDWCVIDYNGSINYKHGQWNSYLIFGFCV